MPRSWVTSVLWPQVIGPSRRDALRRNSSVRRLRPGQRRAQHGLVAARRGFPFRWTDLSAGRRAAVLAMGSVQLSLAAAAWADLATRPSVSVNGSKARWALIIAVNFFGPIAYFRQGRRRPR